VSAGQSSLESLSSEFAKRLDAPNELAAMSKACAQILAETGQLRPPVRLKTVLHALGIDHTYDAALAGKEEASLSFSDGKVRLHISRERFRSSPARARFSIAHEIGHLILIRTLGPGVINAGETDAAVYNGVEQLCDFAASHLLMPREQLVAALRERDIGRTGIASLARLFDVSREALFRSIADIVPDGAVILWRRFQRNAQEPMVWRVWGSYAPTVGGGARPWLPRGCTLKHLSIEPHIDKLTPDAASLVRGVELKLQSEPTSHDVVLCKWSLPYRQTSMSSFAGSNPSGYASTAETLVAVVGRPDRIDPRLFGIRK